jgi:hypothetical protein
MSNDPTFAFEQAQEEACRIAAREDWQSRHGETFWDHSPADWDAMKAAVEPKTEVKALVKTGGASDVR